VLHEQAKSLEPGFGELLDVDVDPAGDWVGVFRFEGKMTIRFRDRTIAVPRPIRFPKVRWLDEHRIALVDARAKPREPNAWVMYDATSEVSAFCAGDGVKDVLARDDRVVVTYFDQGVFGDVPPAQEGLAVFNGRGDFLAGYQTRLGPNAVDIADCYAACWDDGLRIAFSPYTGFPFVRLDLQTFAQEVLSTPKRLHGPAALSTAGDVALFYGPYADKRAVLSWRSRSDGAVAVAGQHPGPLRGLEGGRFISHGSSGFTIVSVDGAGSGDRSREVR
jgi:hypothetical protein